MNSDSNGNIHSTRASDNWFNFIVLNVSTELNEDTHIRAEHLLNVIHDGYKGERYHGAFNLEKRPFFKKYIGKVAPALGYAWFDFDSPDGAQALIDVRRFVKDLKIDDSIVFFTGSKGFHVGVPAGYTGIISGKFNEVLHEKVKILKQTYKTLDQGIYNASRLFRAAGSRHPKTGLYKQQITPEELYLFGIKEIRDLCSQWKKQTIIEANNVGVNSISFFTEIKEKQRPIYQEPKEKLQPGELPLEEPLPNLFKRFEIYSKKLCIKALIEKRCNLGDRHNTALVIISDLFHTGVTYADARKIMHTWSENNGLTAESRWESEILRALEETYNEKRVYSYGCNNEIKALQCSAKCHVWKNLNPETRPRPIDAPLKAIRSLDKEAPEYDVAQVMLEKYGSDLLRYEKNVFRYTGTHWVELGLVEVDALKNEINKIYNNEAGSKKVDDTYKTFFRSLKTVPPEVNLFTPPRAMANFLNGTLHAYKDQSRVWQLEFRSHKREDYVVNVLPYEYNENENPKNNEFYAMLDRVFEGDYDKEEKIRSLAQMYGACLMPIYPHFWFLVGAAGTGKSTAIKIALNLVKKENACSVDPTEWQSFNMETMAGKLVNYDTDVCTSKAISDSKIKKVEDSAPVRITRKGRTDVYSCLPATHIFGGNDIPPTIEGSQRAHTRRWTFIGFDKVLIKEGDNPNKDFAEFVFSEGSQAILHFAIKGLKDTLARNGQYLTPSSGKVRMEEWQDDGDPVAMFLQDMQEDGILGGNVKIKLGVNEKVSTAKLFNSFKTWEKEVGMDARSWSRRRLIKDLKSKGYRKYRGHDANMFEGITIVGDTTDALKAYAPYYLE